MQDPTSKAKKGGPGRRQEPLSVNHLTPPRPSLPTGIRGNARELTWMAHAAPGACVRLQETARRIGRGMRKRQMPKQLSPEGQGAPWA